MLDLFQFTIGMTFTAILNDKLAGFYRSSYLNDAGETEYLGITQFAVQVSPNHRNYNQFNWLSVPLRRP